MSPVEIRHSSSGSRARIAVDRGFNGFQFLAACLALMCGCADSASEFDSLVDEVWLDTNQGELLNASEYLRGGDHYDIDDSTSIDEDLVIPLCDRITTEHGAECFAILFDDDSADFTGEILVKLSAGSNRAGIRAALEEADQQFTAGEISQEWGRKWLAFSFLPP